MDERTHYELLAIALVVFGLFVWAGVCWLIGWVWDRVCGGINQ